MTAVELGARSPEAQTWGLSITAHFSDSWQCQAQVLSKYQNSDSLKVQLRGAVKCMDFGKVQTSDWFEVQIYYSLAV